MPYKKFGLVHAKYWLFFYVSFVLHNELKRGEKILFWQDNALFASKAKINVFWKNFHHSTGPFGVAPLEKISKHINFYPLRQIVRRPKITLFS